MRLLLSCTAAVLAVALGFADDTKKAEKGDRAACLEGTWKVMCAEKNGEPVPDAKDMTVKVQGNTITCDCSKSGSTMKIDIVGPGKAKVMATEGKDGKAEAKEATFILTNDYLAVCVHDGHGDSKSSADYKPTTKDQCTVMLKRESK